MPEKQDPISRLELNTKTHFMTLNGFNKPNDNTSMTLSGLYKPDVFQRPELHDPNTRQACFYRLVGS